MSANGTFFSYAVSDAAGTRTVTFTSLTGSGGSAASAVKASYEALLDGLKYNNTSDTPVDASTRALNVTVNDGIVNSAAATLNVTLHATNDPPVPGADNVITNVARGTSFVISDAALLANDSDPEGSTLTITNASVIGANDSASHAGTTVTFTDGAGGTAGGAFNYTASDGSATASATASVGATFGGSTVSGTAGHDILVLQTISSNTLTSVSNVEEIAVNGATAQTDTITLSTVMSGGSVNLGAGTDTLNLAAGANTLSISNVETVNGTASADLLTLTAAFTGGTIDLLGGTDTLNLANGTNTLTVNNVESIVGGSGVDTITIGTAPSSFTVNLGGGDDILILSNSAFTSTTTINGGSGTDTIQLTNTTGVTVSDAQFQNVTGVEVLKLAGTSGTNSMTLGSNVNTDANGTGNVFTVDNSAATTALTLNASGLTNPNSVNVLLSSWQSGDSLTGGGPGSNDTLSFTGSGATDNLTTGTFIGFEDVALIGSNNTLTLKNGVNLTVDGGSNNTVTLGTGNDDVSFVSGTNTVNATSATLNAGDSLTGGTGADTLTLTGGGSINIGSLAGFTAFDFITETLSSGTDIINLGASSTTNTVAGTIGTGATLNNGDIITGGSGLDTISIDEPNGSANLSLAISGTGGPAASIKFSQVDDLIITDTGASNNGHSDTITLTFDGNFNNGTRLTVDGSGMTSNTTFTADASGVTNTTSTFNFVGSVNADVLKGGAGNDILNGKTGNDTLTGGGGADQFRLQTNGGTDTVTDYTPGTDTIGFLGSAGAGGVSFTNTAASANGTTLAAATLTSRTSVGTSTTAMTTRSHNLCGPITLHIAAVIMVPQ